MGEVVNLRIARKHKARAQKEQTAAENRALHGRSQAQKQRQKLEAEKAESLIEGHRREGPALPKT